MEMQLSAFDFFFFFWLWPISGSSNCKKVYIYMYICMYIHSILIYSAHHYEITFFGFKCFGQFLSIFKNIKFN